MSPIHTPVSKQKPPTACLDASEKFVRRGGRETPTYISVPKGTPRWLRNPQSRTIAKIRGPCEIPDLEQHAVRALLTKPPTPRPTAASQHLVTIDSQRTCSAAQQRRMQQKTGQLANLSSHAHVREGGHSAIRRLSFRIFAGSIVTDSSSVSTIQRNTSNRESQLLILRANNNAGSSGPRPPNNRK